MRKWGVVITVLGVLFLISLMLGRLVDEESGEKIAIIPIKGMIVSTDSISPLYESSMKSEDMVKFIEDADDDDRIKGVILEINSPGGTVVASKEVAAAVKKMQKPVVAVIREVGASGAYWIASAADVIVADELSITGSIGVLGSYVQVADLMEKFGVKYEGLKAGKLKDAGSMLKELTEEERKILQEKLDKIHNVFIREVAVNRKLNEKKVKELATGIYYLGSEAKELGLVDYLGAMDLAMNLTKEAAGIALDDDVDVIKYKKEKSVFDILTSVSETSLMGVGRGMVAESRKISTNGFIPLVV